DNSVLATTDEFGAHLLGEQGFEIEHGRSIRERRDANRLDVVRQERTASSQRIATGDGQETTKGTKNTKKTARRFSFPNHTAYFTTMLTSGPFATTILRTVRPAI